MPGDPYTLARDQRPRSQFVDDGKEVVDLVVLIDELNGKRQALGGIGEAGGSDPPRTTEAFDSPPYGGPGETLLAGAVKQDVAGLPVCSAVVLGQEDHQAGAEALRTRDRGYLLNQPCTRV